MLTFITLFIFRWLKATHTSKTYVKIDRKLVAPDTQIEFDVDVYEDEENVGRSELSFNKVFLVIVEQHEDKLGKSF